MAQRIINICALLALFLSAASTFAQSINVGITPHSWGIEDGLSDRVIQAMAQTPDGYLWLGTPYGLVRFDGYKFVTIANKIAPTIHEFGISCILVAKDGSLWIGSVGGGVTHLDAHAGKAAHYGVQQGLTALTVRALYQSKDGTIWAGTDKGLYLLHGKRFVTAPGFHQQSVTVIVPDGSGGFWIGGDDLTHYENGRFSYIPIPRLDSVIRTLAVGPDGGLWIGAFKRLMERKKNGTIHILRNVHADVRAICFDHAGNLWIGTTGSGVLLRMKNGTLVQELKPRSARYKAVHRIICTRDGDIWIGTQAGLTRLSHTGMDFVKVPNSGTADFGSVFLDHDGSVWLSAGSVSRYVGESISKIKLPALKGVQIRCVYRDASGAFWVGTDQNGAYRLLHGKVIAHLLVTTAITGFLGAPDGSVWIGTDGGLARWYHGHVTAFNYSGRIGLGTIRAMALTPSGSVWVVSPAGLFLFRKDHYLRPQVARRMSKFRIWSLYEAKDGSLWIGTGTGLYLWRHGSLTHILLPISQSQPQAIISILVDARGRFLIARPTQIFRISKRDMDRSIANAKAAPSGGIQQVELTNSPEIFAVGSETGTELYSEIASVGRAGRNGGAWYATYQGLLHIAAAPLQRPQTPPPVTIEKISVDGIPVSVGKQVVLPPSTRNIQFEATPILLSGNPDLELRRRLFGFNSQWSTFSPGSSSSYGKLSPGTYKFEVEAYWPGQLRVSSAQVTILQQSAIYQKKWFLALCCMIALLMAWSFYRFKIHQVGLRFKAVADERGRIAREIHDTLLQGCIGALSLLEALEISQEQSLEDPQPNHEMRWLSVVRSVQEQFSQNIKEAREAIWNLRNADDQKSLDEALSDTLTRLTSRANVEASFHVEGRPVAIIPRVQHEIIMSAREAIMNAVSHARSQFIQVHLRFDAENVSVTIRDDGIGFDPNAVEFTGSNHFGLAGMRDRMQKFRSSFAVQSEPGRGTTVNLSVPLHVCQIRHKSSRG